MVAQRQLLTPSLDPQAISDRLKWYWTKGEGRRKWDSWTELYSHLRKHLAEPMAKRVASQWFHDVKGYWPGSKLNR